MRNLRQSMILIGLGSTIVRRSRNGFSLSAWIVFSLSIIIGLIRKLTRLAIKQSICLTEQWI